ncbi:MAG: hypothetical protein DRI94_12750 [Bacteroidetes bacterium]|nr:MAG: hypothetical protein DRI94_12750 [Bacteroidota bacterium]
MKNIYRIFTLMFITVIVFFSCSEEQKEKKITADDTTENIISDKIQKIDSLKIVQTDTLKKSQKKQKKDLSINKYICPLGCKKGKSDIKGTCPECGMELIENPDYISKK